VIKALFLSSFKPHYDRGPRSRGCQHTRTPARVAICTGTCGAQSQQIWDGPAAGIHSWERWRSHMEQSPHLQRERNPPGHQNLRLTAALRDNAKSSCTQDRRLEIWRAKQDRSQIITVADDKTRDLTGPSPFRIFYFWLVLTKRPPGTFFARSSFQRSVMQTHDAHAWDWRRGGATPGP